MAVRGSGIVRVAHWRRFVPRWARTCTSGLRARRPSLAHPQHAQDLHVVARTSSPHAKRVASTDTPEAKAPRVDERQRHRERATATKPGFPPSRMEPLAGGAARQRSGSLRRHDPGDRRHVLYFNGHQILVSKDCTRPHMSPLRLHGGDRYTFGARWSAWRTIPHRRSASSTPRRPSVRRWRWREERRWPLSCRRAQHRGRGPPNLSLPGDENALISAVAAVNPTRWWGSIPVGDGGSSLGGRAEAWFPESRSTAIANVARRPTSTPPADCHHVPQSETEQPTSLATQFPAWTRW